MDLNFDISNMGGPQDEADDDLEAELAALLSGAPQKQVASRRKRSKSNEPMVDLDKIGQLDDENVDVDENDPELSAELLDLLGDDVAEAPTPAPAPRKRAPPTPVSAEPLRVELPPSTKPTAAIINERLEMYQLAVAAAQQNNDTSKLRRYNRGLITLKDFQKLAAAGKPISEDEIPVPLHTTQVKEQSSAQVLASIDSGNATPKAQAPHPPDSSSSATKMQEQGPPQPTPRAPAPSPPKPTPRAPAPSPPKPNVTTTVKIVSPSAAQAAVSSTRPNEMLYTRRDAYKYAAVMAKQKGDLRAAKEFFRTMKQFEQVIAASEAGQPVDLSNMPPPPPGAAKTQSEAVAPSEVPKFPVEVQGAASSEAASSGPTTPASVLESLKARQAKYKDSAQKAREDGNNSKARRNDRIVKTFDEAIKNFQAGKPVAWTELPATPGFEPFPEGGPVMTNVANTAPTPVSKPRASSSADQLAPQPEAKRRSKSPQPVKAAAPPPPKKMSKQQETLQFLLDRQKQYKLAALDAKKKGDMEKARDLLRASKGFDPMIESLQNGLPVDMSKVPPPPNTLEESSEDFEFVNSGDCKEMSGDRETMYKNLEQQLIKQIKVCTDNSLFYTHNGELKTAKVFDTLGQHSRMDLDVVKNAYVHNDPVPRFRYEMKELKICDTCADLNDNELEIEIIKGLNYKPPEGYSPEDLTTYVKFEFPYPSDEHQEGKTDAVKNSINPEYDFKTKVQISRKARAFSRILKIKSLKLEIYYKRGFLKGDKVFATASMKLADLEEKSTLHESLELMDGRRPRGGHLEVKVRMREPLTSKQAEMKKEKWLVLSKLK